MQDIAHHPAQALRAQVRLRLPGMLRWDRTGQALFVSDARRHLPMPAVLQALVDLPLTVQETDSLLLLDLRASAYAQLLAGTFSVAGAYVAQWFTQQALLADILAHPACGTAQADIPLLRAAMVACGESTHKRQRMDVFLETLRAAHAEGLRAGEIATTHACAVLCAKWLWMAHGIGLPPVRAVDVGPYAETK